MQAAVAGTFTVDYKACVWLRATLHTHMMNGKAQMLTHLHINRLPISVSASVGMSLTIRTYDRAWTRTYRKPKEKHKKHKKSIKAEEKYKKHKNRI